MRLILRRSSHLFVPQPAGFLFSLSDTNLRGSLPFQPVIEENVSLHLLLRGHYPVTTSYLDSLSRIPILYNSIAIRRKIIHPSTPYYGTERALFYRFLHIYFNPFE
jgi:hypothetical protein